MRQLSLLILIVLPAGAAVIHTSASIGSIETPQGETCLDLNPCTLQDSYAYVTARAFAIAAPGALLGISAFAQAATTLYPEQIGPPTAEAIAEAVISDVITIAVPDGTHMIEADVRACHSYGSSPPFATRPARMFANLAGHEVALQGSCGWPTTLRALYAGESPATISLSLEAYAAERGARSAYESAEIQLLAVRFRTAGANELDTSLADPPSGVPEPSTAALIASGLALLLWRVRCSGPGTPGIPGDR